MISSPVHPLLSELDKYEKSYYRHNQTMNSWSILQLYRHLIDKSNEFLDFAEQCEFAPPLATKGRTRFGNLVFLYGEVPWVRIRFRDDLDIELENNLDYAILKESARQLVTRIDQVKTHAQTIDSSRKIYQEELGWLNVSDWLEWLDIHLQYHLRKR